MSGSEIKSDFRFRRSWLGRQVLQVRFCVRSGAFGDYAWEMWRDADQNDMMLFWIRWVKKDV